MQAHAAANMGSIERSGLILVVQPLLTPPRGSRQHSSTALWNGSSPTLQLELPTNSMNYPNIYLKKEGWGKEQVQKIKERKIAAGAEYISKKTRQSYIRPLGQCRTAISPKQWLKFCVKSLTLV